MTLNRRTLFQLFKYAVYTLLAINVYIFWREEFLASLVEYPGGIPLGQLIDAYSATIDTAAWLVLLLMFELETFVLDDRQFTPPVTLTLHGVRIFCYVFIVYACYGYANNVLNVLDVAPVAGLSDLCTLTGNEWQYTIDYEEYVPIVADNCGTFSTSGEFFRFAELMAVVDASGLRHVQWLAIADLINSVVWILIVVLLEIEVRLQEKEKLTDTGVRTLGSIKIFLYSMLFILAVYWGFDGDFVDFWDAFLWLVAFFFIELNVIEWRAEEQAQEAASGNELEHGI